MKPPAGWVPPSYARLIGSRPMISFCLSLSRNYTHRGKYNSESNPCKIYILEVYADREAYQAHLQTAHFRKYKEGTADMVKSLKLIDTNPLVTAEFLKKAQ